MNLTYLQHIANQLSAHFGVRGVEVKFIRGRRGWYSKPNRIAIGRNAWREHTITLLHEFAHHLEFCRNGDQLAEKNVAHGPFFVRCLFDVAEAYYGDPHQYPWRTEYRQVQRIYQKRHALKPEQVDNRVRGKFQEELNRLF